MYLYNENEFCLVKAFTMSMSNNLEHIGLSGTHLFFHFLDCIFLPPRTGPASGSSVKVLSCLAARLDAFSVKEAGDAVMLFCAFRATVFHGERLE